MATKKEPKVEKEIEAKQSEIKSGVEKKEGKIEVKKAPVVLSTKERKALTEEKDTEEKIGSTLNKVENYLYVNGKKLLWALAIVVLIVSGIMAYKYLFVESRAKKAGEEMFVAEQKFKVEEYQEALDGDGNNVGFVEIAQKYSSTPQGNLANHYAGICYLKMGDMDSAMEWLKKYNSRKGIPDMTINAQNIGLQGDIYSQKEEYQKAIELYEKAIEAADNSLITPIYMIKAARVYGELGRDGDAKKILERVIDKYPSSIQAREVEKLLGAKGQKIE